MKQKLFVALIFTSVLFSVFSCSYFQKKPQQPVRVEKPITKVDITIDTTNSYNDLFLDSAVVSSYLAADSVLSDTIKNRITSFYNSRNYQYAWFSSTRLAEQTNSFWNLLMNYHNYSKDSTVYDKKFSQKINNLFQEDSLRINASDSVFRRMELDLTKYLYLYYDHEYSNNFDFDMKSVEWTVPRKRMALEATLDSAIARKGRFSNENAPVNVQYIRLREMLGKYKDIRDAGGWDSVVYKNNIKSVGYEGDEIKQLKLRLKKEGYLAGADSTFTNKYDSAFYQTLLQVKKEYGYQPDPIISKDFIKDLNIPIDERLQQILVNMERMRWIPTETNDTARSIMVNVPDFKLYMYEKGKPAWEMNVVVGSEGHNTTVFTGNLSTIVFSPYWNVPQSIVKNEILPKMKRSGSYLRRNHMEVVGNSGGLPVVRQKPGPWNSLGRVKFLFPNSYNIYLHDSPAKSLFNTDKRSYSHGCIRLQEPARLAQYLLNDTAKWNAEKVQEAMTADKEQYVKLKKPVPVLLTYFTAWVGGGGEMNFREDIYGHDERMAKKLFLDPVATTRHKEKK
ncbi:MAG: L,D-transpeptidase family protein [Petrimonas sp.]|nr:L,D-transpeptidase family protein [Petrimonas sp.]